LFQTKTSIAHSISVNHHPESVNNPRDFNLDTSSFQPKHQPHQHRISSQTDRRQRAHHIPTRPELLPPKASLIQLTKELFIPLLSSKQAHDKHTSSICGIQGTDSVELRGENLEHDECKGELADCCADIGSFKGTLGGADFDDFVGGEDDGVGAVETEAVALGGFAALDGVSYMFVNWGCERE
jgi:hypothetical protein